MDTHVYAGFSVSPYYDPMIAKMIVKGKDRAEAVRKLQIALDEFHVEGIKTTVPLLKRILSHSAFAEGKIDTTFIERTWPT